MPEQNIEVRLSADASSLERDVQGATRDVRGLGQASDENAQRMGRNFQRAGTSLAVVGTAAIAVGVQAVGLANTFELNFAKIEGLVGVASGEIDGMKDAVLQLAGETAVAPQELSTALFTITSAGLRGQEALDALEVAARGSAAGLGETGTVAQAMAGFLNAYAASGITAAEAGDFLAATARAGNFEVSQLAGALGQVTPIASTLGVSTGDLGGSIALLTRTSGNASQAITQVRAVLNSMLRPSGQATEILAEFGLTGQDVRDTLQEDGLVAALEQMEAAAQGDQEAFAAMLGSSEAIGGALSILNADAQTINDTFGAVADSTGVLDEAFEAVAGTNAFAMDQAMVDIKTALTELGLVIAEAIIPVIQTLVPIITTMVGIFTSLPGPIQSVVIALGALALPAGLAMRSMGRMMQTMSPEQRAKVSQFASQGIRRLGTAMVGLGPAGALAGAAIIGLGIAFAISRRRAAEARERAEELTTALRDQEGSVPNLVTNLADLVEQYGNIAAQAEGAEDGVAAAGVEMGAFLGLLSEMGTDGGTEAFDALSASVRDQLVPAMITGTDEFESFQDLLGEAAQAAHGGALDMDLLSEAVRDAGFANEDLFLAMVETTDGSREQLLGLQDLADTLDEQADAYDDVTDSQRDAVEETIRLARENGTLTEGQAAAALEAVAASEDYGTLQDALADVTTQVEAAIGATGEAEVAVEDMGVAAEEAAAQTELLEGEAAAAAEAGDALATSTRDAAEASTEMADALGSVNDAMSEANALLDAMNGGQIAYDTALLNSAQRTEELSELLGTYAGGLDVGTGAGRAFVDQVRDIATTYRDELIAGLDSGNLTVDEAIARQGNYEASLRTTLEQANFTNEEIQLLLDTYLLTPEEILTAVELDSAEARADAEEVIDLLLEYGELTPEALLELDPSLADSALAETLLGLTNFDAESAEAALEVGTVDFDMDLASALLQLSGFDVEEAEALLLGDPSDLQAAVDLAASELGVYESGDYTATLDADRRPAAAAVLAQFLDLESFGASVQTATMTAQTNQASVTNVANELDQAAMPGGAARPATIRARTSNVATVDRSLDTTANRRTATIRVQTANNGTANSNINNTARNRTSTIYVSTINLRAHGGIDEGQGSAGGSPRPSAGVFSSPTAIFGEAGPEAFIPLSPSRRASALPILGEAAERLGATLLLARGGILGSSATPLLRSRGVARSGSGGAGGEGQRTISIVINNPAPEPASSSLPRAMRRAASGHVNLQVVGGQL